MELTDFAASFGLGSINVSNILDKIWLFGGLFLLLVCFVAVCTSIYFIVKRKSKKENSISLKWWEELPERLRPKFSEEVEELIIPGTQLRILYGKKRDIWLPRFNRPIDSNLYYILLTKSGQIVNFELRGLSKDKKYADLEADHTDMLWAAENAREFIKRNYRDKAKKWWEVYADKIAMAALMLVFTMSFVIIIFFMRGIVQDISQVANSVNSMAQAAKSSGVLPG